MLIKPAFVTSEIEVRHGGCWRRYTGGLLHSNGDRPAVCASDGTQTWYHNGVIHRDDDRPAKENGRPELLHMLDAHVWGQYGCERYAGDIAPDPLAIGGTAWREWYKDGQYRRGGDRPTYEEVCGTAHGGIYVRYWYISYDAPHRDNDMPAYIEEVEDGRWTHLEWCQNGKTHRGRDKPADVDEAFMRWYTDGIMQRANGPDNVEYALYSSRQKMVGGVPPDFIYCKDYLETVW